MVERSGGKPTWRKWAREIFGNASPETLRMAWRHKKEKEERETDGDWYEPIFLDKKKSERPDWREYVDIANKKRQLAYMVSDTQRFSEVAISGPALVCYSADWQLGAVGVDYNLWLSHITAVLDTPGVYMMVLGDERENMRSFRSLKPVLDQVLSPMDQSMLMEGLAVELCENGKLLALVEGNHDAEFDERTFGQTINHYIYRESDAPRFKNRGIIRLHVGEQVWPHLVFHKSRYRSFYNALHGAKRQYQLSFPAKVVAGAHDHEPGIEYYWHYQNLLEAGYTIGGMSILLRTGTFSDSDYGWSNYGTGFMPVMPCVLFEGNEMIAFPTLEQGIRHLKRAQGDKG